MKHLYKKNNYYYFKRRVPYTDNFFSFNTYQSSYKKAFKIVVMFNRLSRDLFEYLKLEGKNMSFDFSEVSNVLENYKDKALVEYSVYESDRHIHIGSLLKIKKQISPFGEIAQGGGESEVIKEALNALEHLAVGDYSRNKVTMKKIGKQIVSRGTKELKQLYSKLSKYKEETDLLNFLGLLFKYEASVLQNDLLRNENRFRPISRDSRLPNQENIDKQECANSLQYSTLNELEEDFLSNICNYTEEQLKDSKSNAAKVQKIVEFLHDYIKDCTNNTYSTAIKLDLLRNAFRLILHIPLKKNNTTDKYRFYYEYNKKIAYKEDRAKELRKNGNTEEAKKVLRFTSEELRSENTIRNDLASFLRYMRYLRLKNLISNNTLNELTQFKVTLLREINSAVKNNEIREEQDALPFKDSMLKRIFSKDQRPYKILFDKLSKGNQPNEDMLIARFYVPLIMFFTGSRVDEIVLLKTSDCEIEIINGKEKLLLYIEPNNRRNIKTKSSKRIIFVHDFLANDLNLINFFKKMKNENKEFLFSVLKEDSDKVNKEFNRNKDFLVGNLDRRDEFVNARYSLYSFRHLYKTHMINMGVQELAIHKIQGHEDENNVKLGYFSITDEIEIIVNSFKKHKIIDWRDFVHLTKQICQE